MSHRVCFKNNYNGKITNRVFSAAENNFEIYSKYQFFGACLEQKIDQVCLLVLKATYRQKQRFNCHNFLKVELLLTFEL